MYDIITILGPTAVGKTTTSIKIAKAINGAIISADARQVFRGLDIGSAKIKKNELFGGCMEVLEMMKATDFWPSQDGRYSPSSIRCS